MITCKEDLHGTFIDASDKALVKKYLDVAAGFGIDIAKHNNEFNNAEILEITNISNGFKLFTTINPESKSRQLTMADFMPSNDVKYYEMGDEVNPQDGFVSDAIKELSISHEFKTKGELMSDNKAPRTKTEYVKVTESIFDLKVEYCSGLLSYNDGTFDNNKYETIIGVTDLAHHLLHDNVYLKVETEIDWRNDVLEYLESFGGGECKTFIEAIMENKNAGVKSHNYDGFISMCRLVVDSFDKK